MQPEFLISGQWVKASDAYPSLEALYPFLFEVSKQKDSRGYPTQAAQHALEQITKLISSRPTRVVLPKSFQLNNPTPMQ